MASKDKNEVGKSLVRTIDLLNSFDDDESFEIEVLPSTKNSNNSTPIDLVSNGRPMSSNSIKALGEFMSKVDKRIKSKNQATPINVDFQLAPSLHTRSKIEVKKTNEYVSKNVYQQQKLFPNKKYQSPKTFNNRLSQQSRINVPLKQTRLNVVNIDDMKNYGFNTLTVPKPGESIYPPKKKPQPQKPIFKGIEFSLINNSKYNMTEKEREQKRKLKEQKLKKEKLAQEKAKEERKLFYESMLFGGLQNAQNKIHQQKQHEQSQDQELKNLDMLEQIQNDQKLYQGECLENDQDRLAIQRRGRYSLNEVIKPYDSSHAFPFVKAILGYDFGKYNETSNSRRIPNVFSDPQVYKKTFHYLVINESIADIQQRIKKLEKDTVQRLQIQIISTSQNSNGLSELKIKEIDANNSCTDQQAEDGKQKSGKFLLKNYSMSKNRIGVITTQENFKMSNYGVKSYGKNNQQLSFTFLCLLKTPESKQELKDDVRVESCASQSELEFILKMKKSRKAYFYDIEKLSTNIREYMSISNIQYSFLAPHIYNPNFIETQKRNLVHAETRDCINDVLGVLEKDFNSTQFQSIRQMVLRESGIVLLQGPPGTGKTSTLLGLLSAQYSYLKRIGDSRKIMICAPSNAAINHIAKRIRSEGLVNGQGLKIHPNVLRLGIVDTQDPDITSCSLDHICQSKIVAEKNKTLRESNMTTIQIRQNLTTLQKQVKSLNQQLIKAQRERNIDLIYKFEEDIKQKNGEYIRLEGLLYSFRRQKIISRKLYQEMEKQLIKQAEILIVTLSSSGGEKIEQVRNDIACLIVDEAAQATEPSLLIAFQTGVDKVMLIGDPYQLPATTISSDSNKTLFNRSLFQRFIDSGIGPYFLNIQYRMTPMIRQFPSDKFYQQRLVDGDNIFKRQIPQLLKPFSFQRSVIFIDLKYGQQRVQQSSFCNNREVSLIGKIIKRYKLLESKISVGIITPYQAQRKLLMKEIESLQNLYQNSNEDSTSTTKGQQQNANSKRNSIMINTIDSFQGQQKDLILISTVRANDKKQIGFLMDQRRINVSITRAKHSMIIIGNGNTLGSNEVWDGYLKAIELNKLYFQINSMEDEQRMIQNLNNETYFNFQPITRKNYPNEELTFDPRRIKMKEMNSEAFRKKGKGRRQQQKQEAKIEKGDNKLILESSQPYPDAQQQRYQQEGWMNNYGTTSLSRQKTTDSYKNSITNAEHEQEPQTTSRYDISNPIYPMKKGHIAYSQDMQYQAQQLIKKKRKQQQQTKQFQKYCQRLKEVQKQKANDDFYKFLFQ